MRLRRTHLQLAVLEALVLQHALDRDNLARLGNLGLKDDAERAIANDLVRRELERERLQGLRGRRR